MKAGTGDHDDGFAKLADGGEIAYRIRGRVHRDTPVLLVRPLGGSMVLWGAFGSSLAERFQVISFDHRGTGHSSPAPIWVTTRGLAGDAVELLSHLGVERAHVFGISLGGMTATWLAIRNPSRVARLCLAATPARGLSLSRAGLGSGMALAACFFEPSDDVEASLVHRILSRRFRKANPEGARRIERPLHAEPASRTELMKHAIAGALHDARHELGRIQAPTLVLAGDNDSLLGLEPPRALAAGIPGATFEVIAGSGHDLTLEQPIATAQRVARFLAEE